MRRSGRTLAAAVSLLPLLGACARTPEKAPNIVVILIDTLRADAIDLEGEAPEITPNIRRLAAEGTWFEYAFSHTTWTKPSVATLFTSLYPTQHGVRSTPQVKNRKFYSKKLPQQVETLAERLRDGGYRTAGIACQIYLLPNTGFGQGFDFYSVSRRKTHRDVTERLASWLAQLPEGYAADEEAAPYFLYLHYLDPHWPYRARVKELQPKLGPLGIEPEPPLSGNKAKHWAAEGLSDEVVQRLKARYLHGVAETDRAVGDALAMLGDAGLLDDTVVVLTSDHGEGFYEHRFLLHAFPPYEEVHRIPLMIKLPARFKAGVRRSDALVGLVDVMPTLLDIAGIPAGDKVMGRSLLPLLRRQDAGVDKPVFSESGGTYSLRTRRHKLIRPFGGELEFYDLIADPQERVALPCDAVCSELDAQLRAIIAMLTPYDKDAGEVELEAEDVERLRALGYLTD